MLDRFKRGEIPADHDAPVYTKLADHPGDKHDPAEDGDQSELAAEFHVDPELVKAHEKEKAK